MKDYYDILGVKEDASADEIRSRWIELMQQYHPDHGIHEAMHEERAKEINEAYQVLKYSSTRMEYDFKRQRKRNLKRLSIKKFVFPVFGLAGLSFLFIFCFICFLRPQPPPPSIRKPNSPSSKAELSTIPHYEPGPYMDFARPMPEMEKKVKVQKEEKVVSHQKGQEIGSVPKIREKKIDPSPQRDHPEASQKLPLVSTSKEPDHGKSVENPKPIETRGPPVRISDVHPIPDSTPTVKAVLQVAEVKPPSSVATEEEVRRFFTYYIERYARKDLRGFLSLFSSKAIQNQKEGLEGIRRIYENFFNQSEELHYHMEDTKIEIHQNAIVVKARYEIQQTLRKEKKAWQGRVEWILVKEEGGLRIASLNYQNEKIP
jgi:curved DNA-binding protein CbpA